LIDGKELLNLYAGGGLGVAANKAAEMYMPGAGKDFWLTVEGWIAVGGSFAPIIARGLAKPGMKEDILRVLDAFGIACLPKAVNIMLNGFKVPGAAPAFRRFGVAPTVYGPTGVGARTYIPSVMAPVPHILPTVPGPAIGREAETTLPQGTYG